MRCKVLKEQKNVISGCSTRKSPYLAPPNVLKYMTVRDKGFDKVMRQIARFLVYAKSVNHILPRRPNRRQNTRNYGQGKAYHNEYESMQGVEVQEVSDTGDSSDN